MLLTRLIEHSEQYWATDLSERAVSQLKARMDMDSRDMKLFAQPAHAPLTSEDAPNFGTVIPIQLLNTSQARPTCFVSSHISRQPSLAKPEVAVPSFSETCAPFATFATFTLPCNPAG